MMRHVHPIDMQSRTKSTQGQGMAGAQRVDIAGNLKADAKKLRGNQDAPSKTTREIKLSNDTNHRRPFYRLSISDVLIDIAGNLKTGTKNCAEIKMPI